MEGALEEKEEEAAASAHRIPSTTTAAGIRSMDASLHDCRPARRTRAWYSNYRAAVASSTVQLRRKTLLLPSSRPSMTMTTTARKCERASKRATRFSSTNSPSSTHHPHHPHPLARRFPAGSSTSSLLCLDDGHGRGQFSFPLSFLSFLHERIPDVFVCLDCIACMHHLALPALF